MSLKNYIDWRLFLVLWSASIFSILAILPYVTTLQAEVFQNLTIPVSVALFVTVLQSAILMAIVLMIGLRLAQKIGFRMPILENMLAKRKTAVDIPPFVRLSIILGSASGIAIIILDIFFRYQGVDLMSQVSVPVWQGLLASFYGGISEEILLRLFFMTLVVWVLRVLTRSKRKAVENNVLMWSAIFLAAIVFGIGHLPVTASLTTLTPLVIARALVLNGIGGIVFGWLYWKKGLEAAMIAHFSADIVLHVLYPLFLTVS